MLGHVGRIILMGLRVVTERGCDGPLSHTYDSAGNVTDYGDTTLTWDAENHLVGFSNQSSATSYQYNGYGDRYQQTVNDITTTYLLDYNTSLTQVLAEITNNQTTAVAYLPGIGQQQSNGIWQYSVSDGLGSTRQLLNGNGDVTYAASYEPYGTPFEQYQAGLRPTFGFTSQQQDDNGLVYLRPRYAKHPVAA